MLVPRGMYFCSQHHWFAHFLFWVNINDLELVMGMHTHLQGGTEVTFLEEENLILLIENVSFDIRKSNFVNWRTFEGGGGEFKLLRDFFEILPTVDLFYRLTIDSTGFTQLERTFLVTLSPHTLIRTSVSKTTFVNVHFFFRGWRAGCDGSGKKLVRTYNVCVPLTNLSARFSLHLGRLVYSWRSGLQNCDCIWYILIERYSDAYKG